MAPRAPGIIVCLAGVPVVLSTLEELRDMLLVRDDLFAQGRDKETLLLVLADLHLPGRLGGEQVLELLVVDLDV